MTKPLSITVLALLAALSPCLASGADMAGKLREAYQTELETVETDALFKEVELARKYIAALEHLEQKLAAAGDLDAIVRVREEREAVEKSSGTTSHEDKSLVELREKYLTARKSIHDETGAARRKITRDFTLKLQELETELTKAGDVETAITLRKERERLLLELAGTILFFDDLSEADGTKLDGKLPDMGKAWQQTGGPSLAVSGNAIDTHGSWRTCFANFTRPLEPNELLTITIANLQTRGNFFDIGWAGYSIYTGGSEGRERVFFGDIGRAESWAFSVLDGPGSTSPNTTAPNTVTFTYNAVTGDTTLSLSAGSPGGLVLSEVASAGLAIDSLRIANGRGSDLKFGAITAHATIIPEPAP